jgi:hypothetical protein
MTPTHNLTAVFCLKCGSNATDVSGWEGGGTTATVTCHKCGHEGRIEGFCFGRAQVPTAEYLEAVGDRTWAHKLGNKAPWVQSGAERYEGADAETPPPHFDEALRGVERAIEQLEKLSSARPR